jgi:plastocyanin
MVARNTYVIAVIVAIIIIVAISTFVLSSAPTTTPYPTTTTTTTITNSTTSSTTTQEVVTVSLIAENIKFNATNPTITVKPRQQVIFNVVNKDNVQHNFQIQGVPGSATGQINSGETKMVTVTLSAGTYSYYCSIHPSQTDGQIVAK